MFRGDNFDNILGFQNLWLNLFHLLVRKPNLEKKNSIYSNKFFHNFHLSESSFTCPGLWTSGLARRLPSTGWVGFDNWPYCRTKLRKQLPGVLFIHLVWTWISSNKFIVCHYKCLCVMSIWSWNSYYFTIYSGARTACHTGAPEITSGF